MMDEKRLKELERLRQALDLDPLQSTHITSPGYGHMANLTEQIGTYGKPRGRCLAMIPKVWSDYVAVAVNAVPDLVAEIRQLRADLEWLAEFHDDKLDVNEGKYYWRYDHTNAEYASIHEAIAGKVGAEVIHG